jgi:hypothetical protein
LDNSAIRNTIATIKRIKSTIERLIQMGDNTHHHDQLITLHSFNPMNRMVSAPVKLSPPEDEVLVLMIVSDTVQKVVQSILIFLISGIEILHACRNLTGSRTRQVTVLLIIILVQVRAIVEFGVHD